MAHRFADYFIHIVDFPFCLQLICYAVVTVLLLGIRVRSDGKAEFKPLVFAIECSALVAVFLVVDLLIAMIGRPYMFYFDSSFKYFLGIALFAVVRSKHSPINIAIMAVSAFALCEVIASMGTLCGQAIAMADPSFDIAITKILSYLMAVAVGVLFFKFPVFKFEAGKFDCVMIITCNALSALTLIANEYMRRFDDEFMAASQRVLPFTAIVIIVLFIIDIVTYLMTYGVCQEKSKNISHEVERQRKRSLQEMVAVSESKLAELREVKHDVKNQYAYMRSMLEDNKYDELKAYFNELLGTFAAPLFEQVTSGNEVIDSVLNLELAKMRAKGIRSDVRVTVPPELGFKRSGLVSLFANVIDNAIDACERDKPKDPLISIAVSTHEDELLLVVSNPTTLTQEELDGGLTTSKDDKNSHGYGMKIINKIVKKYNGFYRCYIKDGQFVSECLMSVPSTDKTAEASG